MRKLYAKIKDIQLIPAVPPNANLTWENDKFAVYYIYDIYAHEVQWILVNKTYEKRYVSLLRGSIIEKQGKTYAIPKYIFGNAFADVYFANDLSSYINNLNDVPLYSLAVLKSPSGRSIVGFVFVLPPKGIVIVPEYGFVGLQSLEAELLEVSPENLNLYVIVYDYAEIIEYEEEAGVQVQAPPDPYAVFSYQFKIDNIGTVVTPRVILEVPQSDVNIILTIISDIKKFFHRLLSLG
jgi:hypothetical protein